MGFHHDSEWGALAMRKVAGASPPSSIISHEEGGAPWGKQETLAGMGLEPGNPVSPRKPAAGGVVTQESPTPPRGMEGDSLGGTQAPEGRAAPAQAPADVSGSGYSRKNRAVPRRCPHIALGSLPPPF